MRRLLVVQAVISVIAGWFLVNTKVPIDKEVTVKIRGLSPEEVMHDVQVESARRDVESVLRAYRCSDGVLDSVSRAAVDFRLRPRLLAAEIAVESSCRENVVSPAGAVGLMQVMPRVWKIRQEDLYEPEFNVRTGASILSSAIAAHGLQNGIQSYYGITPGSMQAAAYAQRVLYAASR